MAVSHLEITQRQPFADGRAFGDAGAYERLDGTIGFAVDPLHAANRAIVDLDKAERDAQGRVHFRADFCLLQPVDPARGRRRLLLEVLNRGRKLAPRMINHAAVAPPSAVIDPGDGFLLRHGWTMAWCGWQWDVVRSPALRGLEAPMALEDGRPIVGRLVCEFQPNEPMADALLANRVHHPYPAADVDDPEAQLFERDWGDGDRRLIPRERWRFARDEGGRPVADETRVWLDGGFAPGRLYEVVYRTRISPVVGAGLLAVRDTASFLRYGDAAAANPAAGRIDHAYAFGMSQSGRFLRHFVYLGLNLDEAGRPVFDGLSIHVAGARRGEFNQRYGQPSVQYTANLGHLGPYLDDDQADPVTGRTDGLLRRQRELGGVPKIVATNTSAEYWRGDCSLAHTTLDGSADVEPPAGVRSYHFASTQHGLGVLPLIQVSDSDGARGAHGFNAVDYAPLLRAALINLDRWVTEGEEPPPSVVPRLSDGTAVPGAEALAGYHHIPGVEVPDPALLPRLRRLDVGPRADEGIGQYPVAKGEAYTTYVAAVDADGNEVRGLRMPDVSVPVATYTGWNPRHHESGGTGQIISMQGCTFPFTVTTEERQRTGDPRPSLVERYRDRADYLARVRIAADELVRQRYLLAEDVDLALAIAAERYDAFARTAATVP